jgi:hypothetical protein
MAYQKTHNKSVFLGKIPLLKRFSLGERFYCGILSRRVIKIYRLSKTVSQIAFFAILGGSVFSDI